MKLPARSYAASNDSTSRCKASSPTQASLRKAARWLGSRATADSNKLLTCCQRSAFTAHFSVQPRSGQIPITHHRVGRDFQNFRGLLHVQATKEAQLNHATASRVDLSQTL